jgi:Ran GTPase-activating protein (RanGAP) involved in mRNA processing and transport
MHVNDDIAQTLATGLQYCTSLTLLNLWDNKLCTNGMRVISNTFPALLQSINVGQNNLNINTTINHQKIESIQTISAQFFSDIRLDSLQKDSINNKFKRIRKLKSSEWKIKIIIIQGKNRIKKY